MIIPRRAPVKDSIVHVGRVSPFVDYSIKQFEGVAPGRNVLLLDGRVAEWHTQGFLDVPTVELRASATELPAVAKDWIDTAAIIVLHSLSTTAARIAILAPTQSVIFWSGWGDDYYGGFWDARRGVVDDQGRMVVDRSRPLLDRFATAMKRGRQTSLRRRAAHRVTHFSAPIESDFAVARSSHPGLNAEYLQINYTDVEQLTAAMPAGRLGPNVLLGNSAAPTNNTLDAIERLSQVSLENRLIFAPLSYGHPSYREAVIVAGRAVWGDAFRPLVQFMPLQEYLGVMQSCGIVIMNHWRQQAVGNVVAGLHSGAQVLLNSRNPLLDFACSRGLDVADFSETSLRRITIDDWDIDLERQQSIVESVWGGDVVRENYRRAIQRLDSAVR